LASSALLGVFFHWLGGLASASFYVPYRGIRRWSWETFWITGGVFSWLIAPWSIAAANTKDLLALLSSTSPATLFWCWFWGAMWGFGGLTFGLTMRYLGMSLGMAVVLGLTMVIGTMGPPVFNGSIVQLAATRGGQIALVGIVVALAGVWIVAGAGRRREAESSSRGVCASIPEFDLRRGILVALFSGVMSSCMAFGLAAGEPIRLASLSAGNDALSQGLPVLCVVLAGGFTTNFIWCAYLIARNGSAPEFLGRSKDLTAAQDSPPLLRNYCLAALGGTVWYFQYYFYTMGESPDGPLPLRELDPAHVEHHYLRDIVGICAARMARLPAPDESARLVRHSGARRLHLDHRLR
jgi:L-rhamnose-H+ transport protein